MKKYSKYIIALLSIVITLTVMCFIPIGISKYIPLVEQQVSKEYGINVHIDKLVLRIGPMIKVKAPVVHLIYPNGEKFAQFDTVKFYISWASILKNNPNIKLIDAKKLIVKVSSDDEYLPTLLQKLEEKPFEDTPNLKIKEYSVTYNNAENNDKYSLAGKDLNIKKLFKYKNYKLSALGDLLINNKKYIGYDLQIQPNLSLPKTKDINIDTDIIKVLNEVKSLDFKTDIIADLKLSKNHEDNLNISGFANIDNISVLDAMNKDPYSFIYLTFLGDKTSIKSNIYASADKKIYIEGFFNNSSKPVVDLKVKTDDIQLSHLFKKLRVIADFSKFKNITAVDGVLNANFTLKGDLNKIKSSGYMKINNASINSSGVIFKNINSDIDFNDNKINIINTVGYVNNSPIMLKGTIDNTLNLELIMNKVNMSNLFPENIGIKDGVISLVANITGTFDNIIHNENLQINNFLLKNEKVTVSFDSLKLDTSKNNTAYIDNISLLSEIFEKIKLRSVRLVIDNDKITIPDTKIYMSNSQLSTSGEASGYNTNNIAFNINLKGFVHSKDIKSLKMISAKYPLLLSFNGNNLQQNLNAQVLIEQTNILDEPALLNISSKLDKNVLKLEDCSISSFSGNFANDFKSNLKGNKLASLTGIVELEKTPILKNIRLYIPQALNVHIADTVAQLKGDVFINGLINKPEMVGQISVINLINQGIQLAVSNAVADFNKNTVSFNAPLIKVSDSAMSVNGICDVDLTGKLNVKTINIKSKYLNTDTLLMYKDAPSVKNVNLTVNDGKFFAERLTSGIYGNQLYLSQFNADFKLNKNLAILRNISADAYNGKLKGQLDFNIKDESFTTNVMARGVSAEPIFKLTTPKDESISGVMDFDAKLKGMLSSKNALSGNVKFIIHNGRMSSLGKIEHLIYAQNVVADNMLRTSFSVITKALTLKDTGLFKYLVGDVTLNNGVANINKLQSQGPLMALYIKGQYYIDNDYAKLIVLGRVSDEVISGLGAFGDFSFNKLLIMLTGEDNKYNILPQDFDKIPQLQAKNTKEFRTIINGIIDKPSSVLQFNWVAYSQKSYRQKDTVNSNVKVPSFVDELPY